MNVILNPNIKANLSVDENENVTGINNSQFWKSNKQAIPLCEPK
jgi:hypothetical protein